MQVEDDIEAEGYLIVWVLERSGGFEAGTAEMCRRLLDNAQSDRGLCVGDGQTMPMPGVFDMSDIAKGRGFDLAVRRSDMKVIYTTTHGTPGGNENLDGPALLEKLRTLR